MNDLEHIAEAFRARLIPAVAKKLPWKKTPADSRSAYTEATETALFKILSALTDAAQIEADANLKRENETLRLLIAERGLEVREQEDGTLELAEIEASP
jgi:hypothetical protein